MGASQALRTRRGDVNNRYAIQRALYAVSLGAAHFLDCATRVSYLSHSFYRERENASYFYTRRLRVRRRFPARAAVRGNANSTKNQTPKKAKARVWFAFRAENICARHCIHSRQPPYSITFSAHTSTRNGIIRRYGETVLIMHLHVPHIRTKTASVCVYSFALALVIFFLRIYTLARTFFMRCHAHA